MENSSVKTASWLSLNTRANKAAKPSTMIAADEVRGYTVWGEETLNAMLTLERRRAERSRKPFVLMLLDAHQENGSAGKILHQAVAAVASSTRETDLIGWYKQNEILGVIFTEVGSDAKKVITETLCAKINASLHESLGEARATKISMSLHVFPEDWGQGGSGWVADSKLYPDLQPQSAGTKIALGVKRAIDVAGSGSLMLLLSPVLLTIALIIKLTSEGPVLFEQRRLGQFGEEFKCLKFRTMLLNCDSKIHQDYIQQFIAGKEAEQVSAVPTVYKITNDPRITPIGRFLRKTSLDEFPQLWNVLRGEMSLVGPRPPVRYEFDIYDIWHRRRVFEVKPGITGLWQVSGRSRTRFDEMVRLDLRYCQSWSLWLDVKILLATPWAVFSGDGAY
jgi:lipopolysaccharide/colanic/teichoic acid biosynthesis glycosyltransferase